MSIPDEVLVLLERALAEDRAIYLAAGLPVSGQVERCEWCGDEKELIVGRPMLRNRFGHTFCSVYCRRAWNRAER